MTFSCRVRTSRTPYKNAASHFSKIRKCLTKSKAQREKKLKRPMLRFDRLMHFIKIIHRSQSI